MELTEVRKVAAAWINDRGRFGQAWQALEACCLSDPVGGMRIIEEIHHRITQATPVDYELMGIMAAGPLEDLLSTNSEVVVAQVEELARNDPEFRKCLTGVWQNAMTDEIFARVQRSADPAFSFSSVRRS